MKSYTKKTLVILLFLTLMGGWSLYIDKVFYDRMTTDIENLSKQLAESGLAAEPLQEVTSYSNQVKANISSYVTGLSHTIIFGFSACSIVLVGLTERGKSMDA